MYQGCLRELLTEPAASIIFLGLGPGRGDVVDVSGALDVGGRDAVGSRDGSGNSDERSGDNEELHFDSVVEELV